MTTLLGGLPELKTAEARLRALASARGLVYAFADYGGLRSESDTTKILEYRRVEYAAYRKRMESAGKRPVSIDVYRPINEYGHSWHNYGAAFDVVMIRGSIEALGALAEAAGLRWGGHFARKDTPHFELPITLADARSRFASGGRVASDATVQTLADALSETHSEPVQVTLAPPRVALPLLVAGLALMGRALWAR